MRSTLNNQDRPTPDLTPINEYKAGLVNIAVSILLFIVSQALAAYFYGWPVVFIGLGCVSTLFFALRGFKLIGRC